ncbi:hypothetical protein HIM_04800 [Hirsutella minnesotensis 3608]|uniref:Transmembrane protein UsgS n=1 Tax=Hirsutella minnesotensis 3608 TaxID=1043627 RepID=A0A0F7ZUX9_9HYPO|nr:hypothetical protein HIM_04800 [Hirsutella minnesotensis 3608]
MAASEKIRGEAKRLMQSAEEKLDSESVRRELDVSHFNPNAVIRGAQLTLVGGKSPLQNPAIFTSGHYRQAACAVLLGVAIRLVITGIRVLLWLISMFSSSESTSWDTSIIEGLNFIGEYVLQLPLFLMVLMRYVVPTLDNLSVFNRNYSNFLPWRTYPLTVSRSFMQSLDWVDRTYVQKHKDEDQEKLRDMYYTNLVQYSRAPEGGKRSGSTSRALSAFLYRFARKGCISLALYILSYLPIVGKLVLPMASFYTFNKAVGLGLASIIFGTGVLLPRKYLVIFLQTYFSSRSLMRELLEPYFARVHFSKIEKRNWFRSREGVLFGFGLGFYILMRVPLVGVLVYGIAEASTAYLITKVTDPPPPPSRSKDYAANQQIWSNRHEFLNLSLADLDTIKHQKSGPARNHHKS